MKNVSASVALLSSVAAVSAVLVAACASGNDEAGAGTGTTKGDAGATHRDGSAGGDGSVSSGGDDDDDDSLGDGGKVGDGGPSSAGCDGGAMMCGGGCVDTASDVNNCGSCGSACGFGQLCTAGSCGCAPGYKMCGAPGATDAGVSGGDGGASSFTCSNTQSDSNNCGGCGTVCSDITGCSGGLCVAPVPVDSTGNCVMVNGSLNHALTVDSMGRVYAALVCSGVAQVAVSTDGETFGSGVSLGIPSSDSVTNLSLAANGTTVYAAIGSDAAVYFSHSSDGGKTWAAPTTLSTNNAAGYVQVASAGSNVYVGIPGTVYRNAANGVGAFASAITLNTSVYGGLGVGADGTVWIGAVGDNNQISLASSPDGQVVGAFTGAGTTSTFFPSFGFGPTSVAVVGTTPGDGSGDDDLVTVGYSTPTVEALTTGIAPVSATANTRTIAVDSMGNAYTFGANGAEVLAQAVIGGHLSAPQVVGTDETVQNVAIATGQASTAYGMWLVGANVRLFKFSF